MPKYIMLTNWTEQGIRNVKDSANRLDAAKREWKQHGVEITAFYLTMGRHDMVTIVEAPNDEAVARVALTLGAAGNLRTETLKAFDEAEYRQIIQTLG